VKNQDLESNGLVLSLAYKTTGDDIANAIHDQGPSGEQQLKLSNPSPVGQGSQSHRRTQAD